MRTRGFSGDWHSHERGLTAPKVKDRGHKVSVTQQEVQDLHSHSPSVADEATSLKTGRKYFQSSVGEKSTFVHFDRWHNSKCLLVIKLPHLAESQRRGGWLETHRYEAPFNSCTQLQSSKNSRRLMIAWTWDSLTITSFIIQRRRTGDISTLLTQIHRKWK